MRTGVFCLAALATLFLAPLPGGRAEMAVPAPLDRLQRADRVTIVPERFLRRWDPVTVFLDHDAGPAAGGPEDAPERYAALAPAQPGAWQWLGPRVLQFRPAEPWQPLRRVTVTAFGRAATLVPLLPARSRPRPPTSPTASSISTRSG
jgi:hypothetical protein